MKEKEVTESCKEQLKIHTETLRKLGVRRAVIEIELMHYMKRILREE